LLYLPSNFFAEQNGFREKIFAYRPPSSRLLYLIKRHLRPIRSAMPDSSGKKMKKRLDVGALIWLNSVISLGADEKTHSKGNSLFLTSFFIWIFCVSAHR